MNRGIAQALPGSDAARLLGTPRPTLRRRDILAIVVGIVIGAGIFRTPPLVAAEAGSEATLLLAWTAGGLLSIIGALCYAELAAAFPSVGGDYHFLRLAFGSRLAFLYAWARLSVIQTGSIALLAYVFGDYLAALAPIGAYSSTIYAAAAVVFISGINWVGVRQGVGAQRWLTFLEVAGLLMVVIAGLTLAPTEAAQRAVTDESAIGLMMVFVLLTYGGWSETAYMSAELKHGSHRIGRIMVAGLAIVTLIYLVVNFAFVRALGVAGMAESDAVAAEIMRRALGDSGAVSISLIVAIAALTSANATAITGARTACALGRGYPLLHWLGRWHVGRETPGNALIAQGAIALALVVAGAFTPDGFRLAVEYTAPVFWFFLLLTGLSLFVLRARKPDAARPFKVPLYPLLPAIFCLTSAYLLYSSIAYTGLGALVGLAVLAIGALLLLILRPLAFEETES